MHKALAETLASVIPNSLSRNRWRGILRYGLIRSVKLLNLLKRERNTSPRYYFAICAIAKNEGRYFHEWITWHKNLGAEKFYIYDNESTDGTKEILAPYIESGLVEYTFQPGKKQQLPAYDDCLEKRRLDARWIAVIDLDEFIVPIKDKSIPDFLKRFENFAAVEINWLVYGSGGAKIREPGSVMERFKRHSVPGDFNNRRVKSVVNPRRVFCFSGCHEAARISGKTADPQGNPVTKCFWDREPQQNIIRINHYAVKSYEEFLEKRARGRARTAKRRNLDYFDRFDLNDITDETS
jgi:hypothetical protein